MNVIIVSGLSGSGKTVVLNTLEDLGYYCIDNMNPQILKDHIQDYIKYDFIQDGYFSEMKEQEIRQSRLDQTERIFNQQLIGKIFSMDYVLKNVLRMTDLQVEQQREQIKKEIEDGLIKDPYNDDAQDNY